jgi:L-fuculose-phosphate aldolase
VTAGEEQTAIPLLTLAEFEGRDDLAPKLSPQAEVALLARTLHREGYDEHLSGHISYRQPDGTLLVNPFELAWDELTPADIVRIDLSGRVLEGKWTINPGLALHLALHRMRPDVEVAVHNHPKFGNIWAGRHRVPPIYDQTAASYHGEIALYNQYGGPVGEIEQAEEAVRAIGDAQLALLANHGVLVLADNIRQAHLRCVTLEYRARLAWYVEANGDGVPMAAGAAEAFGTMVDRHLFPALWEAMVRKEFRLDPTLHG